VEQTPLTDPNFATTYYLADQVGTTQMELSSGGWPVWEGAFTPFGQEIVNGGEQTVLGPVTADGTPNRYKFTGKERDTESGLDYFVARYYASSMGRWMSPDWTAEADPVPWAELDNPQTLNLYAYVGNNPLSRTDPFGHASDPCKGNTDTCVTVNADPDPGPPLLAIGVGFGHHFVDQALVKSKDAWNSLAGRFFRGWRTGPLENPGLHKGFSTPHRLNSAQIRQIIEKVEAETGRPMSQWNEADIQKAVGEVKNAEGDVGSFLSHIAENNPTARTVTADVQDVMGAAKSAMDSAKGAVSAAAEDVESACESEPNCGIPPP
jgi:RHS repeat-associated protein